MKTLFTRARLLAVLLLFAVASATNAQTTVNFAFTGAAQTFTVPAGVTSLGVVANGARGGGSTGGNGGRVTATLSVTSGQILNLYVGGVRFNGGGTSNGGGATDIRIGGTNLTNRVLIAGGGGGAASGDVAGGAGGGSGTAGAGGSPVGGGGGGPAGGGTGGNGYAPGGNGTSGNGGAAAIAAAGGGGGGYFGGGGGAGNFGTNGGGGGGSSYTDPTLATNVVHTQGANAGNGSLSLTYTTAALPVTLRYFNSRMTQQGALLGWQTAREDNNSFFQIERSQNVVGFESIGTVPSQAVDGTSVTPLTYAFTDAQPLPGMTYYRLMQTDRDGTRTVASRVVALNREGVLSVLFPNPVSAAGEASIEPGITYASYQISDMLGRIVQRADAPGLLSRVSLAGLPAGVYVLTVQTGAGMTVFRLLR
jgi:hypothetical protein